MANDYYRNQNNRPSANGGQPRRGQNTAQNGAGYRQTAGGRPAQNGVRQPSTQRKRTPEQIAAARRRAAERQRRERNKRILMLSCLAAIMLLLLVFCIAKCSKDDGGVGAPSVTTGGVTTSPETNAPETTAPETVVTTAPETVPPELAAPVPTFKADLSAYEMYMNPTGAHRDAYITLVNNKNALSADFVPPNLVDVKSTRKDGRNTQRLQEYAAKALEALMLEAEACGMVRTNTPSGYPLSVMSAYRDYEYQRHLFYDVYLVNEMNKGYNRADAEKIVATYSARPGTSEHQLGLSVDMHTLSAANQAFKDQPEAKWLADNCHKFGFILRFPEDKMEMTGGIIYEPWHFRYVGRYHATRMKDMGFCLEEYVEYLKNNS